MSFNSSFTLIRLPNPVKSTMDAIHHEEVFSTLDRLNVPISWEERFGVLSIPFGQLAVSLIIRLCGFTPVSLMSLPALFCVSPLGYQAFVRGGHPAIPEGVL